MIPTRLSGSSAALRTLVVLVGSALCVPAAGSIASVSRADSFARQAKKIGTALKRRHLPHGTVFDPVFASPTSDTIVGYNHAGDSAIWTGHYIAAEAFRYAATGNKKAKKNIQRALDAILLLIDVTGNDVLARAAIPVGSPWRDALVVNEARHGIYRSTVGKTEYLWAGNTSRDQYSGVFFGLGFAWELVPFNNVRNRITEIVDRLLGYLINNGWAPQMPDGSLSTTFLGRPDQQLAFLQIGRMVKPSRFSTPYDEIRKAFGGFVQLPIDLEVTDPHGSYFKFNLDHINLVHLVRLEPPGPDRDRYKAAFDKLRFALRDHENAHFNMIERVIYGPNGARDGRTVALLKAWLKRPRRIGYANLNGEFAACGDNRACKVIPVKKRVPTDFLWQRSPFDLEGGLGGNVEGAGIDYLLPYWMARYFGFI